MSWYEFVVGDMKWILDPEMNVWELVSSRQHSGEPIWCVGGIENTAGTRHGGVDRFVPGSGGRRYFIGEVYFNILVLLHSRRVDDSTTQWRVKRRKDQLIQDREVLNVSFQDLVGEDTSLGRYTSKSWSFSSLGRLTSQPHNGEYLRVDWWEPVRIRNYHYWSIAGYHYWSIEGYMKKIKK